MKSKLSMARELFPNLPLVSYVVELQRSLSGCRTVLDVGCGETSPVRFLDFDYAVGIEGHAPSAALAMRNHTHDEVLECDVRDLKHAFSDDSFDCCVALDLIEHLSKDDGLRLVMELERIASRRVLIFTPNGFLPQHDTGNNLQEHLSGWTVEEMRQLGYQVRGMYGLKTLRGERHSICCRPKIFWGVLSETTHFLFTRNHPEYAAAILCVKDVTGTRR